MRIRGGSSLIRKDGSGVQIFHGVVHEGALLSTLLGSLQRCYPNITIIGSVTFYIILVKSRYKLYKLRMRDWTVAVAQYSKFAC
jgi:hypothetical protein